MNKELNISPESIETIEKYLNHSMEVGERAEFEKKLKHDAVFKKEFEEIKSLILGIEVASLRNQLDSYHNEMEKDADSQISGTQPLKKSSNSKYLFYAIAASVLLLLGLYIFNNSTPSYQKIFAQNFVPDSGLPTKMGSSSNFEFYDGMVDYKRGKYSEAIEKWSPLQLANKTNDTLNYFIGVAYLAKGDQQNAENYLLKAAKNSNGTFINETYYYLGLAYLKDNKPKEAKENLQKSNLKESKKIISELAE